MLSDWWNIPKIRLIFEEKIRDESGGNPGNSLHNYGNHGGIPLHVQPGFPVCIQICNKMHSVRILWFTK